MAVLVLSALLGLTLDLVGWGLPDAASTGLWSDGAALSALAAVAVLMMLAHGALWIAALVLSILVIVRARRGSRLWIGGVLALAPVLLGLLFGIDVSGDPGMLPDGVLLAVRILDIAGTLFVALLRAASILFLALGLREAARERHRGPGTARPL